MIIVFDLDDTLYEELTYVKSGFRQVSSFVKKNFNIDYNDFYSDLLKELENKRGKIFDDVLKKYSRCSKTNVKKCIGIYRKHFPDIKLYNDAVDFLNRFSKYPIYIVTDGNKLVQRNKIKALGLDRKVKFSFITHRYGINNSKPSPYCFLKICKKENTCPNNVVYIGDDPSKDFIGIKPLGFKTIRILRGNRKNDIYPNTYEADVQIRSLTENTIYWYLGIN